MIFAVPIVGKILGGAAASEVGAASSAPTSDPRKTSRTADPVDFTQTIDNLDSAAGAKATQQHSAHAGKA